MEEFTKQILTRLDALASKLGVAASAIWGFYLRQARVDGGMYAIIGSILLLLVIANFGLIVYLLTKKKNYVWGQIVIAKGKKWINNYENQVEFEYETRTDGNPHILWWGAPLLPLSIATSVVVYYAVSALYNPGFYAFQQIISNLKSN